MSKEKSNFKKQNKPYYIKDVLNNDNIGIVEHQITENLTENSPQKFKLSIMKDKKVLISIDGEIPHILYPTQAFALTLAFVNICKKVHPECDLTRIASKNTNIK